MFCYCRLCSLIADCVRLLNRALFCENVGAAMCSLIAGGWHAFNACDADTVFSYYRMCSLILEYVLLLQNVFAY